MIVEIHMHNSEVHNTRIEIGLLNKLSLCMVLPQINTKIYIVLCSKQQRNEDLITS